MHESIIRMIESSIHLKKCILKDNELLRAIETATNEIVRALRRGNKLIICGNGGSAADAQHLAAELVSKFRLERPGLPAIALTTNTSVLTAIANDYDFDKVFSRQVEALGQKGDVLLGISTSGNSKNVIRAIKTAESNSITTIGMLGNNGGLIKEYCNLSIIVPGDDTPRIQECHIMIGHILCELIEKDLVN